MKIDKKDYDLLVGLANFHFKFSEYVREQDSEMFYRAIDYAKTFTETESIEFVYWHEENKQFLNELYTLLLKKRTSYEKYLDKNENNEEAIEIWKKRKKTTNEDILGINNYISNFIRHAKELKYSEFDDEDWKNFCGVCSFVNKKEKFLIFAISQIKKYLGDECSLIKEFNLDVN